MIIICNAYKLCYITNMKLKYHDLPFGAQLLLWTSRVFYHGSCRTKPSKYDLVDLAYSKVGINNGSELLKKYSKKAPELKKFQESPYAPYIPVLIKARMVELGKEELIPLVDELFGAPNENTK